MMAGAGSAGSASSVRSGIDLPFASLLHLDSDGTYGSDKGVSLFHFLFLTIHPSTYERLQRDEIISIPPTIERLRRDEIISTHPTVYRVISSLVMRFFQGDPPECPPLAIELTSPRLRGMTRVQKVHLERVLLEGFPGVVPPKLKDIRGISPYSTEANECEVWEMPRPPHRHSPLLRYQGAPLSIELEEELRSLSPPAEPRLLLAEKRKCVMAWFDRCFYPFTQDGIKYVRCKKKGLIKSSKTPLIDFLVCLVKGDTSSPQVGVLIGELVRREAIEMKNGCIVASLIFQVLIPVIF